MNLTKQTIERWKKFFFTKYGRITIDFTIITTLAIIIFRNFLFTNDWPAGGDVLGWISRAYLFGNDRWLYVWRPYSFGFPEGINSMDFFLTLTYSACGDASTMIKIFMFSTFLTAGFTMYAFAYHYNHGHTSALSASLIYCLNQWIFSQFTEAHVDILFSYALAPLAFLTLDRALERRKFKDILGLALILSLFATGFHPESIVIYGFFLLMFILFFLAASVKAKEFRMKSKHLLRVVLPAAIVIFLLSAFSFLPLISNVRAPYYSATFGYPIEDAYKHSYRNSTDAFTLRAVESWGYQFLINVYTDLSLPDFPINTLLLLIFILAFCIIFLRTDRYTVFFAFSVVISIFIAKGPYPPFGYVFTWMWFNVPYFAIFRAASRADMMTSFSHAFLVSVLVSILVGYVQKSGHREKELYLDAKLKIAEESEAHHVIVSVEILNKIFKKLSKLLYSLSLVLLFFIFLSGFLSSFYFFSQGLQVYTPPESYIEPYDWLAKQSGDYKVITVSASDSEWLSSKGVSDFAFNGMLTDIGWSHDIGFDSSFIHGKPTLQDGGWTSSARTFIDYLRSYLVRQNLTDNFLKLLGPFNYKYVVLPEYLTNGTRNFFLHQRGYHVVYNQGSLILQNDYYTPRFFVPNQYVYVVGGLESFASLLGIKTFNLNQTAWFFANQLDETSSFGSDLFNSSDALIFSNSDIVDVIMLSLRNQATFINAVDYGIFSQDDIAYWIRSSWWRNLGGFVWSGDTLTTKGRNDIDMPFKVDSNGIYDIWLRIGFSSRRGKLSVSIDKTQVGKIQPLSNFSSAIIDPTFRLMWVKITSLNLKSGDHTITLTNDGPDYNDIDVIAVIKPDVYQSKMNDILNTLQNFPGRIIYDLEAKNSFTLNLPANWKIDSALYEGYVLRGKDQRINISPEGYASASSAGTWGEVTLWANGTNDENPTTRWASKPHEPMPQWLQIDWETQQELVGVHILFEQAYAEDYAIQTWNGTSWVDQVIVKGNNQTDLVHSFKEPVQTSRLRIYVTSVTKLYDLVSIRELEALSPPPVSLPPISTNVFVPREGDYMFALRLDSGSNYGTATLQVDDFTGTTDCFNFNRGIEWKYFGPIHLDAGSHKITLNGKIGFYKMIVYSLKEEEENISLDDLFKPKRAPEIKYDQISPVKYTVHIENNGGPFLLIFSESYHPMWKAYVNGEEISSISAYSMVNGFYIKKTGSFDVTIYFTGQTYVDIGLRISMITLIIMVAMIATPSKKLEESRKYIKQKMFNTFQTISSRAPLFRNKNKDVNPRLKACPHKRFIHIFHEIQYHGKHSTSFPSFLIYLKQKGWCLSLR